MLLKRKFIYICMVMCLALGFGLSQAAANDQLLPVAPLEPVAPVGPAISEKNKMLVHLVGTTQPAEWHEGSFEDVAIAYDSENETYVIYGEIYMSFLMADPENKSLPFKKIEIKRGSRVEEYDDFNKQVEAGRIGQVYRIVFWRHPNLKLNIVSKIEY